MTRPDDHTVGLLDDLAVPIPAALREHAEQPVVRDGVWTALEIAGVPASVVGTDGNVAWCTEAFASTVLRQPDQVIGQPLVDLLASTDRRTLSASLSTALSNAIVGISNPQRIEISARGEDGSRQTLGVSLSLTNAWPTKGSAVVIVQDITPEIRARRERQRSTLDLMKMSTCDALTGLPNRDKLKSFLGSSLRRAERESVPFAVMICEVTGVGAIRDEHGHAVADEVIVAASSRLSARLRPEDVVARLSAEQFVIVAESLRSADQSLIVANRLIAALTEPIATAESAAELTVGLNVGVLMAYGPEDIEDLLRDADRAMIGAEPGSANTAFHLKLNQA